jgi:signal transduction histidine kinase
MFANFSLLGINHLGTAQSITNYILTLITIVLIILLRGSKSRYNKIAYAMYFFAYLNFLGTLFFVPHDEFRIIWFFLLVFAAYVTGGIRAGNIVALISVSTILIVNYFYGLDLSSVAVTTAVLSLIIATLFFRSYTKKITNFEKELIEQRQLMITQSRFAAMGEMLSMIAHQWRQPLSTTTLLITQERLKLMMLEKQNNEYVKILDKISDTMIYLSDTIDDFQTFFKPEKSKQKMSIDEFFQRINHFIQPRLSTSNVELKVLKCESEEIDTYVNELVQAIINIINNAIDILLEKNISNPTITITFDTSDKYITMYIEDNGGGIEDAIIDKIYDPYFSTKSKNGTGLGLYMSKMIVEQHIKGFLNVQNTKYGAKFSIKLPKD